MLVYARIYNPNSLNGDRAEGGQHPVFTGDRLLHVVGPMTRMGALYQCRVTNFLDSRLTDEVQLDADSVRIIGDEGRVESLLDEQQMGDALRFGNYLTTLSEDELRHQVALQPRNPNGLGAGQVLAYLLTFWESRRRAVAPGHDWQFCPQSGLWQVVRGEPITQCLHYLDCPTDEQGHTLRNAASLRNAT